VKELSRLFVETLFQIVFSLHCEEEEEDKKLPQNSKMVLQKEERTSSEQNVEV